MTQRAHADAGEPGSKEERCVMGMVLATVGVAAHRSSSGMRGWRVDGRLRSAWLWRRTAGPVAQFFSVQR